MGTKARGKRTSPHKKTPTFLLELPLVVEAGQAARQRAHLEAGRQFYNAVLSAGQRRLRQMRADPDWQEARAIPRTHTQERKAAFSALRERYGFSEYAFHELAKKLRVSWLAEHLDAVLAQTLATRAYRALNRVCVGKARRVRFKSRGCGLASIENKRNDTGLRFVLETPEAGHSGYLIWHDDQLPALIDWDDRVIAHGLAHPVKYARLVRRAGNPEHYDEQGRPKMRSTGAQGWKQSKGYQVSRRRKAARELWQPTARACMGGWLTRSRRWATPSSPRRSPTKAGRNATARAWDFAPQGC